MKTLGESDDDDDNALAWINKSRKLQREKEEAEKRVKFCWTLIKLSSDVTG